MPSRQTARPSPPPSGQMTGAISSPPPAYAKPPAPRRRTVRLVDSYQVVVHCRDENDQRAVFQQMQAAGYQCRLLML